MQQQKQKRKGENVQNSVDERAGNALHHRRGNGDARVPDCLSGPLRHGFPDVAVHTQPLQQVLQPVGFHIRLLHRVLFGLFLQGRVHLALNVFFDGRGHQFCRRTGEGGGDDTGTHQGDHHNDQSGHGLQQSPPGAVSRKAQQHSGYNDVYYNRCCHGCLPFLL